MAIGIDSRAHRGALDAAGLTVAVLGSGVDVPYPPRHTRLYEEIVERGIVLAELPPGTTARRWTFPARNRIMAALSQLTVVVEARERSGSLITAEMAQQLNREVGAVPGRVGSSPAAGTNTLLRDGATVIRGGEDVLDSMIGVGAERAARHRASGPRLEPELAAVLDLVERGASSADALARSSQLGPGPLAAALVRLELAGYLRADSGGRYERTALAARLSPTAVTSLTRVTAERRIPVAMTIATSDSGGGAGIQADLKAFAACGVHGTSAIVALTAQNTHEVISVETLPRQFILDQVRAVVTDMGVDAVKIGMLFDEPTIEAVDEALDLAGDAPVVLDPVMVAESGAVLLKPEAKRALIERIVPARHRGHAQRRRGARAHRPGRGRFPRGAHSRCARAGPEGRGGHRRSPRWRRPVLRR